MVGDTSYDMQMARNAGALCIGVTWGYHTAAALTGADAVVSDFAELKDAILDLWSDAHV